MGRFIYGNIENIILVIIMVNIVSGKYYFIHNYSLGIIIDTFTKLRTEENEKN